MKKIVIITTGQPSVNPRVVKEADALQAAGFSVTVLFCFWIQWAQEADKTLLKKVKWDYRAVGGSPKTNKALYFFTRARFKINRRLNEKFGNGFLFAERSEARCFDELLKVAKSIKAEWYIGHNLGALAIAVRAARHNRISAAFDFEDYHREENEEMPLFVQKRVRYLEDKYLASLRYLSTSSPLITKKVERNFPSCRKPVITILNSFPLSQQPKFRAASTNNNNVNLFWFSQTIGKHRGLEALIEALEKLNDPALQLTLAGRCDEEMRQYIQQNATGVSKNIHFAGIIQPEDLPDFASNFDIGLALETGFSTNNNIALSNKIFTYLLAGNAIILSETSMQKSFNLENQIGKSFEVNNARALANTIVQYLNRSDLSAQRLYNYNLAKNVFNWEMESRKLLHAIETNGD